MPSLERLVGEQTPPSVHNPPSEAFLLTLQDPKRSSINQVLPLAADQAARQHQIRCSRTTSAIKSEACALTSCANSVLWLQTALCCPEF
ncbi:hypothetical protein QYF61_023403 [Mycteria americana]|uniref:Uncharacterized protein n=1 Tax=Mycteria americana TaxID=33587 RepID=A0AAN7NE37_MYCAM|nr:hypothetical protein QYF61_023403 [Mycteria americana]